MSATQERIEQLERQLRECRHDRKQLMRALPGAHFCPDWDGELIWTGCPEMEACTCSLDKEKADG